MGVYVTLYFKAAKFPSFLLNKYRSVQSKVLVMLIEIMARQCAKHLPLSLSSGSDYSTGRRLRQQLQ
jgi:hypothetical protein